MLIALNKEIGGVVDAFLPAYATAVSEFMGVDRKMELTSLFTTKFIENAISEMNQILKLIVESNLWDADNSSFAFTIAIELSKLDDRLNALDSSRHEQFFAMLVPSLEFWFSNL